MHVQTEFDAIKSVVPEIGAGRNLIAAPIGLVVNPMIHIEINSGGVRVVQHIDVCKPMRGIYANASYTFRDINFNVVCAVKLCESRPFRQYMRIRPLYKPRVRYMKAMDAVIGIGHFKIDRHLHPPFPSQADAVFPVLAEPSHTSHSIINALVGFEPLIEEPVQIHFGVPDHRVPEIVEIRMAELPLIEITLHGIGKQRIAQHVFQVVKHGGGLVIHMSVPVIIVAPETV